MLLSSKLPSLPRPTAFPCVPQAFTWWPSQCLLFPQCSTLGAAPQRNFPTPSPEAVYETDYISKPNTQ